MQNQIIYQTQQTQKTSFIQKVCSCLSYFKRSQRKVDGGIYQLGIDSPKSSYTGGRKMLVLDLDETLVHSQFQPSEGFDFSVEIIVQGQLFKVFVTLRPGVEQFIEQISEHFDVVMWTASLKEYADPVMDFIDPSRRALIRMYRESCSPLKQGLAKNLVKLGKDLKDVLIIDNSQMSFSLQPDNGLLIKDFYNDKSDRELENLLPFLVWLSTQSDVRPVGTNLNSFTQLPQSLLNSKRASFIANQYEVETEKQVRKSHDKQESHSFNIVKRNNISQRALTLQHEQPDLEEMEMRERCGFNSPHGEMVKELQDQTDDEEKETFEIAQQ